MIVINSKKFYRTVKGKIIISFLIACFALLAAWFISRFAFERMLDTVEEISKPNDRLRLVNSLSHLIAQLDQQQREGKHDRANQIMFFKESRVLNKKLDSLALLYRNDKNQLARIKSIKSLLLDRDKQLINYLQVKETLVNTKSFSDEVQELNELVAKRSRQVDSAVLTTETTTSTKTLAPNEEEKSRGFLSRFFGRKKADVYKIISEELKVRRDTLNPLVEDSIVRSMENVLRKIELEQKLKSEKFLKKEADLALASNKLTQKMLQILQEVESEAVAQVDLNGLAAKNVVNKGVSQITFILIAFLLLTIILLYLIFTDIAKTNKYRIELEQAKEDAEYHSKAKQRFLSNMSHEIRTPLQSILGYAELINKQAQPSKKDVNAIYQSSVLLLQIVNEILDYNRIISGEFKFNNQAFNMPKLLESVVDVMQPLAEQKSVLLKTNFDLEGIKFVNGDAFRLKQILLNLLSNAIKFTLKGEILLNVTCKQNGQDLHFSFSVKDSGIGFSDADINKIFNEFEQVESTDKLKINQTGAGLGLAIVKSLVDNLGGKIFVESKLGEGSLFKINLKYTLANDAEINTYEEGAYVLSNTGKVWVIDDDALILDLVGILFERNNIPFKSFNQVADILNEAPDADLKYVLIDMRMPEMNGVELCKLLKKKLASSIKFYAITAQVLPEEREVVLNEGFDGLILKPFVEQDILAIFDKRKIEQKIPEFNLSNVSKMTLGDKELLAKIISSFKKDCASDSEELIRAMKSNNKELCRLIVHRLAGRTGQMGSATLANDFRFLELEIADSGLNPTVENSILKAMDQLNQLLNVIDK